MSARQYHPDNRNGSQGVVRLDLSFLTNGASDPVASSFRGNGLATVTHAATGKYTVTLSDGFRYAMTKCADLEDLASSDDGAYATIGPVTNEGSGNTTGLVFTVYTRAAAGTKTDYTSRRVSLAIVLKNSIVGI